MKILIGLDSSKHSDAALEFVRKTSWPAGTKAILVSAVRPQVAAYAEIYVPAVVELEEAEQERMKFHQELVSRAEQTLRDVGLRTEARVLRGDPREALVDTARSEQVDLVVVGSHGRTGLSKLVMGSVASHVVAHAPCNVLVVKLPERPTR
ncbi:MAG TPA: universal stress protein [Dongiaceae bacterium]|nr:universal stress protein [Dongiaceae bacterium]